MNTIKFLVGLAVVVLFSTTSANAGALDWIKGSGTDSLNSGLQFVGTVSLPTLDNVSLPTIQDNSVKELILAPKAQPKVTAKAVKARYVVSVSAYSSTPDQTDDSPFITARNTYVRDGIVATNFLPFGTAIKIPDVFGDKIFIVEDRMNRRYVTNVDIWMADRQSALKFGRKNLVIEVL